MTDSGRVMANRFRDDDSGEVVAEDTRDDLGPSYTTLCGWRYPAAGCRLYIHIHSRSVPPNIRGWDHLERSRAKSVHRYARAADLWHICFARFFRTVQLKKTPESLSAHSVR
jgi:hypothetical protein